jgi:hypothetical protein
MGRDLIQSFCHPVASIKYIREKVGIPHNVKDAVDAQVTKELMVNKVIAGKGSIGYH